MSKNVQGCLKNVPMHVEHFTIFSFLLHGTTKSRAIVRDASQAPDLGAPIGHGVCTADARIGGRPSPRNCARKPQPNTHPFNNYATNHGRLKPTPLDVPTGSQKTQILAALSDSNMNLQASCTNALRACATPRS